ncbi:MAG: hypothetical protein K8S23_09565 [Candidatus Cloacimonetes bacterium]|nr:hypothetical protein [Candidatus Cloacimonadota bacterium]
MDRNEIDILEYGQILWNRKKFIIIMVVILTLVSVGVSFILPKWYKATAMILPQSSEQNRFGGISANLSALGLGGVLGGDDNQLRLIAILKSRTLLEKMNEKFDFQSIYETENEEEAILILHDKLEIKVGDEEQIIVSFLDKNQETVANMTNYVISCLDSLNISLSTLKAKNNKDFVGDRVKIIRDSLYKFETEYAEFMNRNDIIDIDTQLKIQIEKIAKLKAEIMAMEIKLEINKTTLAKNSPLIASSEISLNLVREKYDDFINKKKSENLFLNLDNLSEIQKEFAQLERNVIYYNKLFEYLGPQYEQAKIEEAKKIPTIQVLDYGIRPEKRFSPKRRIIVIISFLFSLIFSIIIVFIKYALENYEE